MILLSMTLIMNMSLSVGFESGNADERVCCYMVQRVVKRVCRYVVDTAHVWNSIMCYTDLIL